MKTIYNLRTSCWCRDHNKQINKFFDSKKKLHDFCIINNLCFAFDVYISITENKRVSVWRCF